MARNIWRLVAVSAAALVLAASASGCSLLDVVGSTPVPPPAPSSSTQGGATGIVTLVGEEVFHVFAAKENQADFTMVPATGLPVAYLDGTGQVGQLDTSPTDPTIQSLNIVFNNANPHDVVTVTLYNYQGTVTGTVQVKASGSIDLSTYNAVSCRLTATATGTPPSPAPYVYLYQMTNSAGNIFTYTVPVPPS